MDLSVEKKDMAGWRELAVSETFTSIQGESSWIGLPCFFIRLAGCNLDCSYCDTRYAREGGAPRSIESLVEEFRNSKLPLAMVTGGEPLLQNGTVALLAKLSELGEVLLETNGSLDVSAVPERVVIIMDVKCPGSGESGSTDFKNLNRLRTGDEVKFVMSDRTDFEWALNLVRSYGLVERGRSVLFSAAEGTLSQRELAEWMIEERVPARLNLRAHKILWPTEARGR